MVQNKGTFASQRYISGLFREIKLGEPLQKERVPIGKINASSDNSNDDAINVALDKRSSQELILAFAGPIGCGISLAIHESKRILETIGYEVHIIKLSKFIQTSIDEGAIKLESANYENTSDKTLRILKLQDGGNELRKKEGSILAACAMQDIALQRGTQAEKAAFTGALSDYVPKRTAYLIDQIKHPDEVSMLRKVYGNLFHLIGVISIFEKRKARLTTSDKIDPSDISMLIERDRRQEDSNGQQLDKALQMADFFISSDQGTMPSLNRKLKRFLNLLHHENGVTPTAQEYGMYVAYAAGLKSACLSRQVGAAISDKSGKIVSTGCNDVPKAMGGLYTSEDQTKDRRCVHREEQICFNDREKESLKDGIGKTLRDLKKNNSKDRLIDEDSLNIVLETIYKASHIKDLIEFSRAVHAEMDAIISLARVGTPGIAGSTLYTTTFPCHSCARHIVAAGITKVYYIEPYEKSLAQKLHDDAIAFEVEDDEPEKDSTGSTPATSLVKFIHFEGISPRQYLHFFKMGKRKDEKTGRVISIIPIDAPKSVGEYLDDYRKFEAKVIQHLNLTLPAVKRAV